MKIVNALLRPVRWFRRGGFIQRRLLFLIPQIVAVMLISFIMIRLVPGNPAIQMLGPQAPPELIERTETKLGLNDSLPEQFFTYVKLTLRGDLGDSWFTSQPVRTDIAERLPGTIELMSISMGLSVLIMIPLGVRAARPKGRLIDKILAQFIRIYGLLAGSLADFWLALIFIYVFFTTWNIAPTPLGALDVDQMRPESVTNFLIIDSIIAGEWGVLRNYLGHLVGPVLVLMFVYGGPILKITYVKMTEIEDSPYLQNARVMGLQRKTLNRYALRNALPPIITTIGVMYGFLLGGAVLVENVFSINGFGNYGVKAVLEADYAAVQGFLLVSALFIMFVYLVVDILHAWSDPRVRL